VENRHRSSDGRCAPVSHRCPPALENASRFPHSHSADDFFSSQPKHERTQTVPYLSSGSSFDENMLIAESGFKEQTGRAKDLGDAEELRKRNTGRDD